MNDHVSSMNDHPSTMRRIAASLVLVVGSAAVLVGVTPTGAVAAVPAVDAAVTINPASGQTATAVAARHGAVVADSIAGPPVRYLLQTADGRTADQLLADLAADPAVGTANPNGPIGNPEIVNASGRIYGWAAAAPTEATSQYAVDLLGLPAAHRISTGAGITVAVVDTGVQLAPTPNPVLAGALVRGIDLVDGDGVPDDARTGAVDPVTGLVDGMAGHGTHVAGIVHLAAPDAKIMPVRVLDSTGSGTMWNVAKGMTWAADHGATVINASLGAHGSLGLVRDTVSALIDRGVVVVAAAGNDARDRDNYPAATRCAVSVAASDANDAVADFSTTGSSVSVAAPGVSVTSIHPFSPTGYAAWSGSSMSSPFAAGTAAMIRSVRTSTSGEVLALIAGTSHRVTTAYGTVAFGRIDAAAAVSGAAKGMIPTATDANIPARCLP